MKPPGALGRDDSCVSSLPPLSQDFAPPAHQEIIAGEPRDYVGIYAADAESPWIVIEQSHDPLRFNRVERWFPRFECALPPEILPPDQLFAPARYFQLCFRGVPSERGRFGPAGACVREVSVRSITRAREGRIPEATW